MKRFLICGLGSIGQRHVRILRERFGSDVELHAFRVRGLSQVIHDDMHAEKGLCPIENYQLSSHSELDAALSIAPDAVWVTNPISMHLETALKASEAGAHLFIEKPLSHSLEGALELKASLDRHSRIGCVGYQLRFHPALVQVKRWLEEGVLGELFSAHIHFGEWLPGMHPYEDYRTSHAAREDQGGGAILCLSHEIDYACWLFGKPRKVFAAGGLFGDLEMDVESSADLFLHYQGPSASFAVSIHVDFHQRPARRYCSILGDRGRLEWDDTEKELRLFRTEATSPEVVSFSEFERNDLFRSQLANFIDAMEGKENLVSPLQDGIETLKICLAAKESIGSHGIISLD